MSNYKVRKLYIGKTEQMDKLSLASGELYSKVLTDFWNTVNEYGIWLKRKCSQHLFPNDSKKSLHSSSADAVVESFFSALKSWHSRRKEDPDAKPPKKCKKFYRVQWKSNSIKLKDKMLYLSNGKNLLGIKNQPLIIPWPYELPTFVEMGWNGKEYELRSCYKIEDVPIVDRDNVVGVDLGEIHMAVANDGTNTTIINGRLSRSKRQYRNKLIAKLDAKITKKKRGSSRRKKLVRSKKKQLKKIRNQIHDIEHKQINSLVSTFSNVQTVVIGDLRNLRKSVNYGKTANQKIHQMPSGRIRRMITYKSERLGLIVKLLEESYTSQTCPLCNEKTKPNNRNFKCSHCGFTFHRDGIGAINIRRKYLGIMDIPVVGVMTTPIGVRYYPNAICSSGRNYA